MKFLGVYFASPLPLILHWRRKGLSLFFRVPNIVKSFIRLSETFNKERDIEEG